MVKRVAFASQGGVGAFRDFSPRSPCDGGSGIGAVVSHHKQPIICAELRTDGIDRRSNSHGFVVCRHQYRKTGVREALFLR